MIKVGFIGAGGVANIHKIGIRELDDVEVVALTKKNLKTAQRRADELGIPNVCGNYREILDNPEIDAVHCLVPNNLHYEVIKAAIQAGKHVMAEKPLTVTVKEAEELTTLAGKSGRICGVNFRYRYFPLITDIRQRYFDGKLGKVRLVHGSYLQDWLSSERDYNWRLNPEISGNLGTTADIGSHWFDMIEYILEQKVTRVSARLAALIPERVNENQEHIHIDLDDSAVVLFELENGALGTVIVSQVATGRRMSHIRFEINGTISSMAWNKDVPDELWVGYREKHNYSFSYYQPQGHSYSWDSGVRKLMENFYGAIRAHKKGEPLTPDYDYPTFEDGLRSMRILTAIYKSHRASSWAAVKPAKK
jgi:predicted dehydrogenase